jgi:hypothetical protein
MNDNWLGGLLLSLKVGGLVITGILGLLAVFTNFRKEKGLLNRWGRLNAGGLILALFIGLSATIIEARLNEQAALKSARTMADLQSGSMKLQEASNNLLKRVDHGLELETETNKRAETALTQLQRSFDLESKTANDVARSLEPIETLSVHYALVIPIGTFATVLRTLEEQVHSAATKTSNPSGAINRTETNIFWEKSAEGEAIKAMLGPHSDLLSSVGPAESAFTHVPFEMLFTKRQPQSNNQAGRSVCRVDPDTSSSGALYKWRPTKSVIPDDGGVVATTPTIFYGYELFPNIGVEKDFVQMPHSEAVFYAPRGAHGFLTASDFSQAYLHVMPMAWDPAVHFRFILFRLRLGRHEIEIPLKAIEIDACGGFTFRLPKDLDSLPKERASSPK